MAFWERSWCMRRRTKTSENRLATRDLTDGGLLRRLAENRTRGRSRSWSAATPVWCGARAPEVSATAEDAFQATFFVAGPPGRLRPQAGGARLLAARRGPAWCTSISSPTLDTLIDATGPPRALSESMGDRALAATDRRRPRPGHGGPYRARITLPSGRVRHRSLRCTGYPLS